MNKNKYINIIKVAPCGATVAPHWAKVAPSGAILITWPADLTTANRSEHNSKQNKLVRSVEQTIRMSVYRLVMGWQEKRKGRKVK